MLIQYNYGLVSKTFKMYLGNFILTSFNVNIVLYIFSSRDRAILISVYQLFTIIVIIIHSMLHKVSFPFLYSV